MGKVLNFFWYFKASMYGSIYFSQLIVIIGFKV
jgi:hypothetical protein